MLKHLFIGQLLSAFSCVSLASTLPTNVTNPVTSGHKQHWQCTTAEGAEAQQKIVLANFLPAVVFINESQPIPIETRLVQSKTPALSVAVIRQGKLAWSAAWGNLTQGGSKADCHSLFQAGSLAKPVTLFATLRMKQKALLNIDENIDHYLKSYHLPAGVQTAGNPVSMRNILAHTSGITAGGYDGYPNGQALPTDLQTVLAEPPANGRKVEVVNAPNSGVRYSGGGYTVLEIALQDRFAMPFDQLLQNWVLTPFGMKQAKFTQPIPTSYYPLIARGHTAQGSMVAGGWHNHPEQAAAGLWATPSDMANFLIELRQAYLGKSKLISKATMTEFLANPIDGHAYGFRLIGEKDQIFITHYGGTAGYRVGMTMNLETGDGAVYMSNSDNGSSLGSEFLGAVSRTYNWPWFRETQVKRQTQTIEALQALAGQYVFTEQGWKIQIAFENNILAIIFPNGDRYAMTPIVGDGLAFIHADTGVRASFEVTGDSTKVQLYGQTGTKQ
ncbi:serine hydrolase domain-containing protein [Undibacterium flavidum]|uniref:Beta-lactamase family protein n=1 Tax=Undibacterium flavidum TaxID=2762297 RepID=A0ABR6Y7V2_9BURK|nr:serine hydrolase domain-containing protein [Undibacterium flavidum]MBC3872676.1 beta-lactamase family protein [Undibacterium flavidum]